MQTIHETILSYMILSGNDKQVGYPQLREAAKDSWYKLFKSTNESIIRKWYDIERGEVKFPKSMENLLGVMTVDSCGKLQPLYEDDQQNTLVIPVKKCSCNKCDFNNCMCPSVQDGVVQTDVTYNGTVYTNKVHTRLLKNGNIVEERYEWIPSYNGNSELQSIEQSISQTVKASVETNPCGCVKQTEENYETLMGCGCIQACQPFLRDRYPALYNQFGYYKVNRDFKTISIFDTRGKKTKLKQVILVFQSNGADMLVPDYAQRALKALMNWTSMVYSRMYQRDQIQDAKRYYYHLENEMIQYINPIPFELISQSGDYHKRSSNEDYLMQQLETMHQQQNQKCAEPVPQNNIITVTKIINTGGAAKDPLVGVVGGGGIDDPLSGETTFQSNKLIGLGASTQGRITILLGEVPMSNYGANKSFDYDPETGIITLINGILFVLGSALFVNTNQ